MTEVVDIVKAEIPFLPGYYCDMYGNIYNGMKPIKVGYHRGVYGYVRIRCVEKGVKKNKLFTIARLMGAAWLGASEDDVVCFMDGNRYNTVLDNLYLGSKGELMSKSYQFRKSNNMDGDKRLTRLSHRAMIKIYQYEPDTKQVIKVHKNLYEAASYMDVPVASIERCCTTHTGTCCTYGWCYDFDYLDLVK